MRRQRTIERHAEASILGAGVAQIEKELELDAAFPPDVLAAADASVRRPAMPDRDRTDLPLVTLDPAGAMDLDQAFHIERLPRGYRVYYAIADVSAFVESGGPVDAEASRRGQTLYAPDHRIPLYPKVISEGAASLLPGEDRPALLWTIDLDMAGDASQVDVVRARVRSRQRLDYATCQRALEEARAEESILLLREIGLRRIDREIERGGVSLPVPDHVVDIADGKLSLSYRTPHPIETWNAQLSLLTGMEAAEIMLYGEEGILRTLPAATEATLARLQRTARALRVRWDVDLDYQDFVRQLDTSTASGGAMAWACASLFGGAGYVSFDGVVPEQVEHAALATEYAHVTAPLRRLVDRYAGEIAVSMCADQDIPDWVRARMNELPRLMERSDALAHRYQHAIVALAECAVMEDRIGESFEGVVVEVDHRESHRGTIVIADPAVQGPIKAATELPRGEDVTATLVVCDVSTRSLLFEGVPRSTDGRDQEVG